MGVTARPCGEVQVAEQYSDEDDSVKIQGQIHPDDEVQSYLEKVLF